MNIENTAKTKLISKLIEVSDLINEQKQLVKIIAIITNSEDEDITGKTYIIADIINSRNELLFDRFNDLWQYLYEILK